MYFLNDVIDFQLNLLQCEMSSHPLIDEDELEGDPVVGGTVQGVLLRLRQDQLHGVVAVKVLGAAPIVA